MKRKIKLKVCGVRTADDLRGAIALGVDYVGLNFIPSSRRFCADSMLDELAAVAKKRFRTQILGLFKDESNITIDKINKKIGLDGLQLCGSEPRETLYRYGALGLEIWRASAANEILESEQNAQLWHVVNVLLLDASHGRGAEVDDFSHFREAIAAIKKLHSAIKISVAGGINAGNIARYVAEVGDVCHVLDCASGLEEDGVFSQKKLEELLKLLNALQPK